MTVVADPLRDTLALADRGAHIYIRGGVVSFCGVADPDFLPYPGGPICRTCWEEHVRTGRSLTVRRA